MALQLLFAAKQLTAMHAIGLCGFVVGLVLLRTALRSYC